MQENHKTTSRDGQISNASGAPKENNPQIARLPRRLSVASTLEAMSAALALVCTFWYLDTFRSMAASSDFPDIGIIQVLALGFFGFLIGICVLLTLVGFLCTIGFNKKEATSAHLPLFVSLWAVGLFLSIHTVSVAGYVVATLVLFPLFYWLYRRRMGEVIHRKRLLAVGLACLAGIGVIVALAIIVHQGALDDVVLRLLFFAT